MSFSNFIKNLEQVLQMPLPGEEAQFAMAPYERKLRKNLLEQNPSPNLSAVLVLFYPVNAETHTVFILRNTYTGVHSGQVGFPGGKKESRDKNLIETALREAEEEIGIEKEKVKIIGKLSHVYIPPSGFLVQPYIGFINFTPVFKLQLSEVKEIIEAPLKMLLDEKTIKTKTIRLSNGFVSENTPYFDICGNVVWGATAMMLGELKEVLISLTGMK